MIWLGKKIRGTVSRTGCVTYDLVQERGNNLRRSRTPCVTESILSGSSRTGCVTYWFVMATPSSAGPCSGTGFPPVVSRVLCLAVVAYAAVFVAGIARNVDQQQWDFAVYYYAAKAHLAGADPYDPKAVSAVAGRPVLEFRYPPIMLWTIRPLAWMDFGTAYLIFLGLKCALVVALVLLWSRRFLDDEDRSLFVLFCLVAFGGTLALDVQVGNCLVIEQVLVWLAFDQYLRRRYVAFSLLILLVASVRLFPLAFALLLVFTRPRRWGCFAGTLAAFAGTLGVSYLADRELFLAFVQAAGGGAAEPGRFNNPCNAALVRDLLDYLHSASGVALPPAAAWALLGPVAVGVAAGTWWALRRIEASPATLHTEKLKLYLVCLAYALVMPRFKSYYYILLIVPAYVLFWRIARRDAAAAIAMMLALSATRTILPPSFVWDYHQLLVAWVVWLLYLWELPAWSKDGETPR